MCPESLATFWEVGFARRTPTGRGPVTLTRQALCLDISCVPEHSATTIAGGVAFDACPHMVISGAEVRVDDAQVRGNFGPGRGAGTVPTAHDLWYYRHKKSTKAMNE